MWPFLYSILLRYMHGFAAGVTERAGHDGLSQMFNKAGNLPTPNELDAPGLWLARIELQDK